MIKRGLALALCLLMAFTSVQTGIIPSVFVMEASAVNIETLKKTMSQIPDKSQWETLYLDSSTLSMWYESAEKILENPASYTQDYIDNIEKSLKTSFESLKYHTQSVALNKTALTLSTGQTYTLKAFVDPENTADPITWASTDTESVSVSNNGLVTVKKYTANPVTIYASSNGKKASCVITVTNPLTSVTLSPESKTIYDSHGFQLTPTANGADKNAPCSENVKFYYKSSSATVAAVSDSGYVTGRSKGKATIVVTAQSETNTVTASCEVTVNELVEITSLVLQTSNNKGTVTMVIGETKNLNVKIVPENASIKNIAWTVADSSVAALTGSSISGANAYATVKALKAGKTDITYTSKDSSGKSGVVTIEVLPLVSFISLSETVKVISPTTSGEKLKATVLPENAGNKVLNWSSSDNSICQVDNAGVLIPKKNGVVTITAKATDSSGLSASCKVRVSALASSVSVNKSSLNLKAGQSTTLKATVKASDGTTYNDVEWISEDTKVATVNANGVVTAKYPGTTKIRAVALDGTEKSAVCVVTVTQSVTGISLPSSKTMGVGTTAVLNAEIEPDYASNKKVTWKSSNTKIATVDQNGKITAKNTVGTCKITVTTDDGGKTATCVISVVIPTTSVKLNKSTLSLDSGETETLKATVAPSDATDKKVTWSSSDTAVATVSSTGVVTAKSGGKATITAKTSGGQTAKCTVTVKQSATGVNLDKSSLTLYASQTATLNATPVPSTATTNKYTWKSSNTSVLTVVGTGRSARLTAIKAGTATITVTLGNVSTKCTVKVTSKVDVKSVSIPVKLAMLKGETKAIEPTITPSNASNKDVTWSTSNASVATVTPYGVIKATGTGTAVITVKTKDGGKTDSCNITVTQKATGVNLSKTNITVAVGKTQTLKANLVPSDTTNKKVVWVSSNPAVASVNQSGVVTGKKTGAATILVTTDDGGFTASCNVVVNIGVTGIKLSSKKLTVPKGGSKMLTAIITPADATNQTLVWSTSDSSVASVNAAGQVTGRKTGTAVITAKTKDGGYTATCIITVVQYATSIKLDYTSVALNVGKTKTLTAKIRPGSVTDKTIKWSSTNKKVAKVNKNGKITAVSAGTAVIKAKSGDGKALEVCRVTVIQPVTEIKFEAKSYNVKIGQLQVLKAEVLPADATYNTVTFTSSDEKIATVDSDGVVKGLKKGTVTITASAENGRVKATCKVHVRKSVKGVSLDKSAVTLAVGKKVTLNAYVVPASASNQKVKWSSNNYDVASVDKNGVVTAKSSGYVEITATSRDGGYKAICRITVIQPVRGIKFKKAAVSLDVKESTTLVPVIKPSDATNKKLTWTSSNKKVVKVNSKGKITALKTGSAVITVKTADGGYTATCKVTVLKKVKKVTLNKKSLVLYLTDKATLKATVSPSNATNKKVTWKSSDTKVLKVDKKGKLTPVKPGKATVTVTTADGGLKAKCTVKVEREVKGLSISKSKVTLKAGKTFNLKASVSPKNATNKNITYTTSDKKVATVSSKGVIKAVNGGKATITAKTANGITKKCVVTVLQNVKSVSLDKKTLSLYTGSAAALKATVSPKSATDKSVKWASSKTSVATVSASGKITALKAGKTVISVVTDDGGYIAKCTVTVLQHVTGVKFSEAKKQVVKGKSVTLKPIILPSDATDKGVTYTSSVPAVATVTDSGVLTAKAVGETVITVTTKDKSYKATMVVSVVEPVTSVALNPTEKTVFAGQSFDIKAIVSPTDATNKLVRWSCDNSAVASVNSDGKVTANKSGTCIVTAETVDGGFKATCKVTVLQKAKGITLDKTSESVNVGKSVQLIATVTPSDAHNKKVTWATDKENIVTVSESGLVTAVNIGTATITATSEDGGFTAKCTITVKKPVTGIIISRQEASLYKNESTTVIATVSPSDATDKTVNWSSSDSAVASVKDGLITAKNKGSAVISAVTADGNFKAVCLVTVKLHAEKVEISESEITVSENASKIITASVVPEGAENSNIIWKSDDESVATVRGGEITGVRKGETTVKAISEENGELYAVCKVTVTRPVSSVSLETKSGSVYKGETLTLKAAVLPEDANDKSLKWTSSDESVATVSAEGVVTGIARGNAVITVTTVDGGYKDAFALQVKQLVEQVNTAEDTYHMAMYESIKIEATTLPENADDRTVVWTSSDESIATVDQNGIVYAFSKGTVMITAKAKEGTAEKKITVEIIEPASSVTINGEVPVMWVGSVVTVTAKVLPETATYTDVTWTTSDEKVVKVEDGKITAVSAGEAIITATSICKKAKATAKVTVRQQVTGIELSALSISLDENPQAENNKHTLTATVMPQNAYDKTLTWSSLDEGIATVSPEGVVTAVSKGNTQIQAVSADGRITARCIVTVIRNVSSVEITPSTKTLYPGETATLTVTVLPETADNTTVTWSSVDERVASVDAQGVVTAVGSGTTSIFAKSADGLKQSVCIVTVKNKIEGISFAEEAVLLEKRASVKLSVSVLPLGASEEDLLWKSDDETMATVVNGVVTAGSKGGEVTITAYSKINDSIKATKKITIVEHVTQIQISDTGITKNVGESHQLSAVVFPVNATNQKLIWTTSDPKIITVDNNGLVKAVGTGTATVFVRAEDNQSLVAACTFNVN